MSLDRPRKATSQRSAQHQRSSDGLNLSLTGSQISTISVGTAHSRPQPVRPNIQRPNSMSDIRPKTKPSFSDTGQTPASADMSRAKNRHLSKGSASYSFRHSEPGLDGKQNANTVSEKSTNSQQVVPSSDDFLALFDSNSPQPKIRTSSLRQDSKKAVPSTYRLQWKDSPLKNKISPPNTSRSKKSDGSSTIRDMHNVFTPMSARSSSDYLNGIRSNKPPSTGQTSKLTTRVDTSKTKKITSPRNETQRPVHRTLGECSISKVTLSNRHHDQDPNSLMMSQESQTSMGITNNMTSQALSPRNKASLSSIEKSFQNIKHKSPVNQVQQGRDTSSSMKTSQIPVLALTSRSQCLADEYIQTVNMAATKIQHWYRRHNNRRKAGEAAMKRLMDQKRKTKEDERRKERIEEEQQQERRKQAREDKAKQARQQAIQELQKKREEKRTEVQRKAEEQLAMLQSEGKILRSPKKRQTSSASSSSAKNHETVMTRSAGSIMEHGAMTAAAGNENDINMCFMDDLMKVNPALINSTPNLELNNSDQPGAMAASPQTREPSQTCTTFNDLMDTLMKLEEEERLPTPKGKEPNSWLADLNKDLGDTDVDNETKCYLTEEKLAKFNVSTRAIPKQSPVADSKHLATAGGTGGGGGGGGSAGGGYLSDDKLNSILTFLDEIQTTDRLNDIDSELKRMSSRDYLNKPLPPAPLPSLSDVAQMEQAEAMANEVTSTVLSQKQELDEKKRSVNILQKALAQQRELTVRHAKETEKEMNKRFGFQQDEYEETIKRHLSFIDQLIDDKKLLSEKCENLVRELKTTDQKYQDKMKRLANSHSIESQKLKDVHSTAEKLRREKWVEEKTKKIKEMTVKGLEPEIQRLIAKHKSELQKVKQVHEADLLASDERAAQRYVKMTEELRDQLASEKEAACARERELTKQRYEKQLEQEELAYQQQQRRLYAEIEQEKSRLSESAARQLVEMDHLKKEQSENHTMALSSMKSEFEMTREEQDRRHHREIHDLEERLKVEKEVWEENLLKKQETYLLQKERELKEHVRKERDREIEQVISRLEEDGAVCRSDADRTADNKIRRLREKYESEIRELEASEKRALEKYSETKGMLTEVQCETERNQVILRQKEHEIDDLKQLLDKLHGERDRVSDVVRQEFADRIVATEEENKRFKQDMSELKARHRIEIERTKGEVEIAQKQKEEEMEEVHKRVKQAISKKEEIVTQIKQQYDAAVKRADHLEGLLEQQRKQLLGK